MINVIARERIQSNGTLQLSLHANGVFGRAEKNYPCISVKTYIKFFILLPAATSVAFAQTPVTKDNSNEISNGPIVINGSNSLSGTGTFDFHLGTVILPTALAVPSPIGQTGLSIVSDGSRWIVGAGSGGVSSVALSMPDIFTVTHSPVTSAGTLTVTTVSEPANCFWAGPTNGSPGLPTFRPIVNADLPAALLGFTYNGLTITATNGTLAIGAGKTLTASNTVTFAGSDGATLNYGSGGTLSASAYTDTTNASNISSGTLAPSLLPLPTTATVGGVKAKAALSNFFLTAINADGSVSFGRPTALNILGLAASATTDTTNANNITSGTLSVAVGGTGSTTASGTGPVLLQTDPKIVYYPNSITLSNIAGAWTGTVDSNKRANVLTITNDVTLTFGPGTGLSNPPTQTFWGFGYGSLTNSDTVAHVVTIPSSYSFALGALRTSFTLQPGAAIRPEWLYTGTTYYLINESVQMSDLPAAIAPNPSSDWLMLEQDGIVKKVHPNAAGGLTVTGTPSSGQTAEFVSSGSIQGVATTGTGSYVKAAAPTVADAVLSGHPTIEGVTSTGATGTGPLVFGTSPTISNATLTSPTATRPTLSAIASLGIRSSGSGAFDLQITNTENLTANRRLTATLGDASRTLTLSGDPTLGDWFNQSVKTTDSPTFAGFTVGNVSVTGFNGTGAQLLTNTGPTVSGATLQDRTQFAGQCDLTGTVHLDRVVTSNLSGQVNNYGTTAIGIANVWRIIPVASYVTITGLSTVGIPYPNYILAICNVGTNPMRFVKLTNNDPQSTTTNRFQFPYGDVYIAPNGGVVWLRYDNTLTRWVLLAGGADTGPSSISTSYIPIGAETSLATNTATDVASLTLDPGDWDVSGVVSFDMTGATTASTVCWINSTSVTNPADGTEAYSGLTTTAATEKDSVVVPRKQFLLTASTTIYLSCNRVFSAGSGAVFGSVTARRLR